jgi:hypothetical protein
MKKNLVLFFAVVFCMNAFTQTLAKGIYIAGEDEHEACYWIVRENGNTVKYQLSSAESVAFAAVLIGEQLYIAGVDEGKPCFWIISGNMSANKIMLSNNEGQAHSIITLGGKLHIAGYENRQACYWIVAGNRIETVIKLSGTSNSTEAYCIVQSNGKMYISGHDSLFACCWIVDNNRNVRQIMLPNGEYHPAFGIAADKEKVYLTGRFRGAAYWTVETDGSSKKSIFDPLPGSMNVIAIAGEKIYIGGRSSASESSYWIINGNQFVRYDLLDNESYVSALISEGIFLHIIVTESTFGLSRTSYWKIRDEKIISSRIILSSSYSNGAYAIVLNN